MIFTLCELSRQVPASSPKQNTHLKVLGVNKIWHATYPDKSSQMSCLLESVFHNYHWSLAREIQEQFWKTKHVLSQDILVGAVLRTKTHGSTGKRRSSTECGNEMWWPKKCLLVESIKSWRERRLNRRVRVTKCRDVEDVDHIKVSCFTCCGIFRKVLWGYRRGTANFHFQENA